MRPRRALTHTPLSLQESGHQTRSSSVRPGLPNRQPGHLAGKLAAMDKATVMQVLGSLDEEMVFKWSYQLRCDPHPRAQELYKLVHEYLDQSF